MTKKKSQTAINPQRLLARAKSHAKKGAEEEARQLYSMVLDAYPENQQAKKGLKALQQSNVADNKSNLPQAKINAVIALYSEGRLEEALNVIGLLTSDYPKESILYNISGACYGDMGQTDAAVSCFKQAIAINPGSPDVHKNLGNALGNQGMQKEAVESYQNAIRLKPDYAEAYFHLGNVLLELAKPMDAQASYEKAIRFKPDYAEAHYNLGIALDHQVELNKAIGSYERAIRINPAYAKAHNNLGVALKKQGESNKAVESYEKAIRYKPDFAEAYCNRGNAFQEQGKLQEAVEDYEKAIQLKPDYAEAFYNYGNVFLELGKPREAVENYEKAIQFNPDYAEAYCNRGNAFKDQGKLREALASYEKAIQVKPDFVYAHQNITKLKTYERNDKHVAFMERLLSESTTVDSDRLHLIFALAKAYEDFGEHKKSFSFLQEGNRLRKNELHYNINRDRKLFDKIVKIFASGSLSRKSTAIVNSIIRPIFIVGMPRSGTSLVEQILASHSLVYGAGELETMPKLVWPILSQLTDNSTIADSNELLMKQIEPFREDYLEALTALDVSEQIITDKLPLNFRWIGFILSAFPSAKIIHLNRDPMATCWSVYKNYFSGTGNGYAYDISDLAEFYKLYIELMSFWREKFGDSIYQLSYENLTENQEQETRKLLEYCELNWEQQCLDFHNTDRIVRTASAAQVRKKMYRGSSEAWRKYEEQLKPLIEALE